MNLEKIFIALNNDETNSALGLVCAELEKQGYDVIINNIELKAEDFFNNKLESLEQSSLDFNILLKKNKKYDQEFCISFFDYHRFIVKAADKSLNYTISSLTELI